MRRPDVSDKVPPGSWRWINPTSVRWHRNKFDEKAVAYYMAHPDGRLNSRSGDPFVSAGGVLNNGAHRAEAARRTGRRLHAYVADPPARANSSRGRQAPSAKPKRRGFFYWD